MIFNNYNIYYHIDNMNNILSSDYQMFKEPQDKSHEQAEEVAQQTGRGEDYDEVERAEETLFDRQGRRVDEAAGHVEDHDADRVVQHALAEHQVEQRRIHLQRTIHSQCRHLILFY